MRKIYILYIAFLFLITCEKAERRVSDFEKEKTEMVKNSEIKSKNLKLFLDFKAGMSRKEYDNELENQLKNKKISMVEKLVSESEDGKKYHKTYYFIINQEETKDTFFFYPIFKFKVDSLQSIVCYLEKSSSFDESINTFYTYQNILNKKYGNYDTTFQEYYRSENYRSSLNFSSFWLEDNGLCIDLNLRDFQDSNFFYKNSKIKIQYSTIEHQKYLIERNKETQQNIINDKINAKKRKEQEESIF